MKDSVKMNRAKRFNVAAVVGIMVASVMWVSSVSGAVLTQYSFEDNGNDTAAAGTTADNLSVNGTISYESGVVGQAVSLASGYFDVGDNDDLDLATSAWSVECFIKDGSATVGWKMLAYKWTTT